MERVRHDLRIGADDVVANLRVVIAHPEEAGVSEARGYFLDKDVFSVAPVAGANDPVRPQGVDGGVRRLTVAIPHLMREPPALHVVEAVVLEGEFYPSLVTDPVDRQRGQAVGSKAGPVSHLVDVGKRLSCPTEFESGLPGVHEYFRIPEPDPPHVRPLA